jgi:hypothetical protein
MGAQQKNGRRDMSGIPELDDDHRRHDVNDMIEEIGRDILNAFTVERDTSLADGAGAPGSTNVGGFARGDREDETPSSPRDRS